MKCIGVTATTTLTRTLYIEVPEDMSENDIIEKGKKEIVLPHNALGMADNALKRARININGLDLKDWNVTDLNFKII